MRKIIVIVVFAWAFHVVKAQVGEYRNDFSVGANAGYVLSNVDFLPRVTQGLHGGFTGGLSVRYVCEKYFNTICSIYGEVNYVQAGWKESILDQEDNAVINEETGLAEQFERTINYIQIPVFAHLAWGKEHKGMQFFFQAGPQIGFLLGDRVNKNFEIENRNRVDRANSVVQQDTMDIQHSFDYGIAAGAGIALNSGTFSNSGVRAAATGTTNGTININTNGTTADVAVKGLAALAYIVVVG